MRRRGLPFALTVGLALVPLITGCADGGTEPSTGRIVEGVDFDALFADPQPAEIAVVSEDWAARDVGAVNAAVEKDTIVTVSTLGVRVRVVSHDVGDVRHFGAILTAEGLSGPAPVIVYAHGGDTGVTVEEILFQFGFVGDLAAQVVWVVPSFRSEELSFGGVAWTSGGPPSPWDWDVDDALSLLDVTLELEPAADVERVGVLGFSRGAGVAMLMGVRDPRIERIVEFFGPTDFFDSFVQDVVEEALGGSLRSLPGLAFLDQAYIQPLKRGEITMAEARQELIRRSTVLFAERLPKLQLHHGTADAMVAVSQAESLVRAMEALGRGEPDFDPHLYEGGSHSPFTLPGSIPSTVQFLSELLPPVGG